MKAKLNEIAILNNITEGYPVVVNSSNGYSYSISYKRSGFDEEFILACSAGMTMRTKDFKSVIAQISRLKITSINF